MSAMCCEVCSMRDLARASSAFSLQRRLRTAWVLALLCATLVYIPNVAAAEPKRIAGLLLGFLAALVAVLTVARRRAQRLWPLRPLFGYAPFWSLGLVLLVCASLGWGLRAGTASVATFVSAALFCYGAQVLGTYGARRMLSDAACACGVVHALAACFTQWRFGAAVGVMGNPNELGLLLSFLLPLAMARLRKLRALGLLCAAIMVAALFFSHSRTAQLSLTVAICIHVFRSIPLRASVSSSRSCGALHALSLVGRSSDWFRDASWSDALAGRWWIFRHAWQIWVEHPLGVGAGGFGHAYLASQGRTLQQLSAGVAARAFINADTAHASVMHIFVEQGALGGGLLAGFWICLLRALARAPAPYFCAAISVLLASFGDMALHIPPIALFLGVLVAASPSVRRGARISFRNATTSAPWSMLLSVASMVAVAWLLRALCTAMLANRVRVDASTLPPDEGLRALRRSFAYAPNNGESRLNAGLLAQSFGSIDEAQHDLEISDRELANVGTKVALANLAYGQGNFAAAKAYCQAALTLDHGSLKAHLNLAETCHKMGDVSCAFEELRAAKEIAPFHPKLQDLEERLQRGIEPRDPAAPPALPQP
jgi:tetratricopeptide (TPR) repeat protein